MAEQPTARVVDIYTDGACSGNPGPGGWGAVLRYGPVEKEMYGGDPSPTTNNRMELMAPIQALESLTRPAVVHLHTDSTYVRDGITRWLPRWKSNGWQTTGKQPVKNADLWRRLDTAANQHQVHWLWVKGHAGHPDNERADRLAARGLQKALRPAGARPAPVPAARRSPSATRSRATNRDTGSARHCTAATRGGKPCPIPARPSGLCHVHDPAVQCGSTKSGQRCTIATGGGLCTAHQITPDAGPGLF